VTAIHDTAYPRIRTNLTTADLIRLYSPTPDDLALADRVTKGADARLTFCILLKTFQCLGSFMQLRDVPQVIVYHITNILHDLAAEGYPLDPDAVASLSPYLQRTIDRFGRYELDPARPASPVRFDVPLMLIRPSDAETEPTAPA
jgi:hypothetical protein